MPLKETAKKITSQGTRLPISDSSLVFVPSNAVEGYQDRIETGIDWMLGELALRHHRKQYFDGQKFLPTSFSEAVENKIKNSFIGGFVKNSNITLQDQWDVILATEMWDNEKFANEEGQICYKSAYSLTDDIMKLIKEAVRLNDRKFLADQLKKVQNIRLNNAKITHLDSGILQYKHLVALSLCGNRIETFDGNFIPATVRSLELQLNYLSSVDSFVDSLPPRLLYLGLAKNLLTSDAIGGLSRLPHNIQVLDLSDNNILTLHSLMENLARLPYLNSLYLFGNPCSVSYAYARFVLTSLPRLQWLDNRQILPADRSPDTFSINDIHPDDLRSTNFFFTVFRVMGAIQPPKPDKGTTTTFHVELEIPLLDSVRRQFLLFRNAESLTEMLPVPEDLELAPPVAEIQARSIAKMSKSIMKMAEEPSSHDFDIYLNLEAKNPLEIRNFTTFESNKVQWNKIMNFQEPTIKIFCPDLVALRNTFKTTITLRLVYTCVNAKPGKTEKKSAHAMLQPAEQRVVLAEIKCGLKNPDWTQHSQHFHWDDTLNTNEAIHWGEGDLSVLQYTQATPKPVKGKPELDAGTTYRQLVPENLTCHFGFGIETYK